MVQLDYISLINFVNEYNVVEDIDVLLQHAEADKLLSRYNNLIKQQAELFKYWVINHQTIIDYNELEYDYPEGAFIIMHAIMMVEANVQADDTPVIPYLFKSHSNNLVNLRNKLKNQPELLRYYRNFLYVILQYFQPKLIDIRKQYYLNYYIYEIEPYFATHGYDIELNKNNSQHAADQHLAHRNCLIYNYMLDHYVETPWDNYITTNPFTDLDVFFTVEFVKELERNILTKRWFNFTCYHLYMSYYYFIIPNPGISYKVFMNFVKQTYGIYRKKRIDYATVNALIRLSWSLRRETISKKYNYTDNEIPLTHEIEAALNGYISVHSQRALLMQMIARYGLYPKQSYINVLEKYIRSDKNANKVAFRKYEHIITALGIKIGVNVYTLHDLSVDQRLGILYTGIVPIINGENLTYIYYFSNLLLRANATRFDIEDYWVSPQFSKYIYYKHLHDINYVNINTLLNLLQTNKHAYDVLSTRGKYIYIYPSTRSVYLLLESFRTFLVPLDNISLMQHINRKKLGTIYTVCPNSKITYLDMTLTNEQLAHKYNIRNIYRRTSLLNLIAALTRGDKCMHGNIYYRRGNYVLGDGKLWDTIQDREINIDPTTSSYFSMGAVYDYLLVIKSIIDALDARNNPAKYLQVTGYPIKFIDPKDE